MKSLPLLTLAGLIPAANASIAKPRKRSQRGAVVDDAGQVPDRQRRLRSFPEAGAAPQQALGIFRDRDVGPLHEDGGGLAGGADPSLIAREQRRFAKKNLWCDWGLNATVVSGGQWTRLRRRAAGYCVEPTCPRCEAAPESLAHRIWECPQKARMISPSSNSRAR